MMQAMVGAVDGEHDDCVPLKVVTSVFGGQHNDFAFDCSKGYHSEQTDY
jgi:hypothetical protein